ncbi:hypothetical protein DF52_gp164 [Salmonella phage vB-SalM-SJ2]|uniref:Uncharacterized protein n=1 Tax=Salmonella phage vB-SalM-SJ2 TaxID=1458849 RepID=W8JYW9_9CAUD|nr:hypothetical protein DF52_gp164 [Salmonella phage vB-SalM-SJ2]AHK61528.1 hypothetical protein [Salmonella phage vB-SalM-SJ2]
MTTAKVTIYAFDAFSKFDAFVSSAFGIKEVEAEKTFCGGLGKFANLSLSLTEFMKSLEGHFDAETIRTSLLKKDGTPRKLAGKTRIYDADGFTVSVHFTEEPVYELFSGSEDLTHYVVRKGDSRPVFESGDILAAIKELARLNSL